MKKFRVIGLLLIGVLAAFAHAQAPSLTQVYVRIDTGNDDLRAGSELLLVLARTNGTNQRIPLILGRRLADRTPASRVYPIPYPFPLNELASVTLSWVPGRCSAPCQTDQWEMANISIHVGGGPGDPTLQTAAGSYGRVANRTWDLPYKFVDRDEQKLLFNVDHSVAVCSTDRDCDDRTFCNGVERCEPANPLANASGCVAANPACRSGLICNEAARSCGQACTDNDGDGHLAASCGGDDCDDNDAARYPGNIELFNDNDKDQDCDPNTHGFNPGSINLQFCDGRSQVVLVGSGEQFRRAACITGTVCVSQPNGEGVCMTEPPGYQAPSSAVLPTGPQRMPAGSTNTDLIKKNMINIPVGPITKNPTSNNKDAKKD